MDPSLGINAGLYLLEFLATLNLNKSAKDFVDFSNQYLHNLTLEKNGNEIPY